MNKYPSTHVQHDPFKPESYSINNLEDEISADKNCQELLKHFLKFLLEDQKLEPLEAGSHARGADYFLRDYMIDRCRDNIFTVTPEKISGFAGNWYIVNTLEPNIKELTSLLNGIRLFYIFCNKQDLLKEGTTTAIEIECSRISYFQERIESFHDLKENEFQTWNNSCPIS